VSGRELKIGDRVRVKDHPFAQYVVYSNGYIEIESVLVGPAEEPEKPKEGELGTYVPENSEKLKNPHTYGYFGCYPLKDLHPFEHVPLILCSKCHNHISEHQFKYEECEAYDKQKKPKKPRVTFIGVDNQYDSVCFYIKKSTIDIVKKDKLLTFALQYESGCCFDNIERFWPKTLFLLSKLGYDIEIIGDGQEEFDKLCKEMEGER
jgi:hypothetical protein